METQTHFNKNILYLHIAVMLFGLAGVVAQFVEVSAVMVALGRVVCSSTLLLLIALVKKDRLRLDSQKDVFGPHFSSPSRCRQWQSGQSRSPRFHCS